MHDVKPLLGLAGVIVAAMTTELNDQVSSIALLDIEGALGLGHDPGTWFESLYVTAMVIGMALSPCWAAAVSLRRMVLFAILLDGLSSVAIPYAPGFEVACAFRVLQGLSQGLTIPLLMIAALRFLKPAIRLYGLACYAMTATFFPNLSAGVAALWTDYLDWRFIFFETLPLCILSALLVSHGLPRDPPNYHRLRLYDWSGTILAVVGLGALTTMLEHGNRLDWFNSPFICVLALVSSVAIPLLVLNESLHEIPLFSPRLLKRRNFAYGVFTLFCFVTISLSSSAIPSLYLGEVQGYRPLQTAIIMMEIAGLQLIFLPLMVFVLDKAWIDSRWVNGFGLLCIMLSCLGSSRLDSTWNREQFYLWQGMSSLGQASIVLSLLMMSTNSVRPHEGQFASSMVNLPRAISEAFGVCLLEFVSRVRGQFHSTRLLERIGTHAHSLGRGPGGLADFHRALSAERTVLVVADQYLILAGLSALMLIVLMVLPVRTHPPRIALAAPAPAAAP